MAPKAERHGKEAKFLWNDALQKTFITLCLDWQATHGLNAPFSWLDIAVKFTEKTGKEVVGSHVMKNKFDHMKKKWKAWKDLRHLATGLGWDAATGTIMASPDWWEKRIQENDDYKTFRKKGVPQELETLWDQLFGSIVATGQYCVAPSMDAHEAVDPTANNPIEEEEDESHSDDAYQNLYNIDLDKSDPEVLQNILKEVSTPTTSGIRKQVKRTMPGQSQSSEATKTKKKCSVGSALFNKHMAAVSETSQKILTLCENEVGSSAAVDSSCTKTVKEVVDVVKEMVKEGLMTEGTPLWCFSVNELKNHDQLELFFSLDSHSGRKAWFEWLFENQRR